MKLLLVLMSRSFQSKSLILRYACWLPKLLRFVKECSTTWLKMANKRHCLDRLPFVAKRIAPNAQRHVFIWKIVEEKAAKDFHLTYLIARSKVKLRLETNQTIENFFSNTMRMTHSAGKARHKIVKKYGCFSPGRAMILWGACGELCYEEATQCSVTKKIHCCMCHDKFYMRNLLLTVVH